MHSVSKIEQLRKKDQEINKLIQGLLDSFK